MENEDDNDRCVFPLKGLQIGDLQSYLSHLSVFMASDSKTLYILVDNRPWLKDLVSRPTHLWQLMVTKSRLSPFANTRGRKEGKMMEEFSDTQASSSSNSRNWGDFKKWFLSINALMLSRKRALLPVKKLRNSLIANSNLHRTLYGFIVFQVEWGDVRGINYLNELQTDTSLAIEAKVMRRWEFDSIAQAVRSISRWFPGTRDEQILLEEHLDASLGEVVHDAQERFPRTNDDDVISDNMCTRNESYCSPNCCFNIYPVITENESSILNTPPPLVPPYKRRKIMTPIYCELGNSSEETDTGTVEILRQAPVPSKSEEIPKSTMYRDVLIILRFNDRDLPFKLKDIIMPDLRLLTLLEAGLPSWVIFLQSYPVFRHIYRPWMCPLARALYVLISIVTVLVGFYDLYKNVPLLKATASSLFGPFFDWIETLEMISRIKYLGTMLFLHNFQKAVKWFLMVTRAARTCLSFVIDPMAGPLAELSDFFFPLWSIFVQVTESFFSVTWMVVETCFTVVGDVIEILLLPVWYMLVVVWNIATYVFWIIWEIAYAPVRVVLGFCGLVVYICKFVYELVGDLMLLLSGISNLTTSEVESTVMSYEVSMWRSLWNDLFSQVFRALRSIVHGFVAFCAACNRHRLSIYNHMKGINNRITCAAGSGRRIRRQSPEAAARMMSPISRKEVEDNDVKWKKMR